MRKTIPFLFSITFIVPIIILCRDFYAIPISIQTVVIEKQPLKYDYHVYLKDGQISLLPSQYTDYCRLQFGDTVTLEKGPYLKITHFFTMKNETNKIDAGDYTPMFLIALIPLLLFFISLWFFVSDFVKGKINENDIWMYYLLLALGIIPTFVICSMALK